MFRCGLLTTTALVIAGSFSFLAAQSAAHAGPVKVGSGRDRNGEFLCTYGAFPVSAHYVGSPSSFSSTWTHVAVPIVGRGKTISRIIVRDAPSASTSSPAFRAGIYSNTANGPGKLLSGGTGMARSDCGPVTVAITPVQLKRKTVYWVEEKVGRGKLDRNNEVVWASDPKAKRAASRQVHSAYNYFGNSSSHTSSWTGESTGAYVRVR